MDGFRATRWVSLAVAALLTACAESPDFTEKRMDNPIVTRAPAPVDVPASPEPGSSRAGLIYTVSIPSPLGEGMVISATVMEPTTLVGGVDYPLVVHSHGFGARKLRAPSQGGVLRDDTQSLLDAGYGVISFDQTGHGDTTGLIRLMDPDYEGQNAIRVIDWAEAHLDWLAYRGGNLLLGTMGQSYGGAWQLLLNASDPKRRLDAMAPRITWYDLNSAVNPGGVAKSGWLAMLFALGSFTGGGGNFDPYVNRLFVGGLITNQLSEEAADFLGYHSNRYFCEGEVRATNGGPGTAPLLPSQLPPPVNAIVWQGMRDTIFNFSEAYANYQCLKAQGGDVRLLGHQSGHNSLLVMPDLGVVKQPPQTLMDNACGPIDADLAIRLFFDEHLKGIAGAADAIGRDVCLSLSAGDAVRVPALPEPRRGAALPVPRAAVLTGYGSMPTPVDLGVVAGPAGDVLGGATAVQLTLSASPLAVNALGNDAIVFVGVGHRRAGAAVWELVDNQLQPLRGLGTHAVRLPAVAERLAPGDRLGLLFYGTSSQFYATTSAHPASGFVAPVMVQGEAWLPLLGPLPAIDSASAPVLPATP